MEQLRNELLDELKQFQDKTEQFLKGEISVKDYKGYSGGFGSYAQRGAKKFMLRLRMNQGRMTKDKCQFICDTMKAYDIPRSHITTCQTIQLHDVNGEHLTTIMAAAMDHDIITRGGGGDFPRNVMCSPLTGVDPDETFDVLPYARAVGDYLLSIVNKYSLPRKLKVAFSNSERNETHANFRDLGFIANGDHTFDVYCCGGLGNNPKMGVKVANHVDPSEILYYVNTMVLMFMEHGEYQNRAKARSRYMQDVLGKEALISEFQEKVSIAKKYLDLDLHVEKMPIEKMGNETLDVTDRVLAQKQPGLYAVSYHPYGGNVTLDTWNTLSNLLNTIEDAEIRLTPQEGLWIINLTADEAKKVLEATNDGAKTSFEASVACIGASTCQVGVRDSQAVLASVLDACRPYEFKEGTLPRIFISGCPSSCGTNQIGMLGFQGFVKMIDKKAHPAFKASLYGSDALSNTKFGQEIGLILQDDMPKFFVELGQMVEKERSTFETFIVDHKDQWDELVNRYMG